MSATNMLSGTRISTNVGDLDAEQTLAGFIYVALGRLRFGYPGQDTYLILDLLAVNYPEHYFDGRGNSARKHT